MKFVCVYCGSSSGASPAYRQVAGEFGKTIAARGMTLVYGGASVGVMGALADSVLLNGGRVIGVIPQSLLDAEVAHDNLSELHVTATMHQRKSKMESLSDGFVAMPGGFGTFEELFEILTWRQLRFHDKPIGILNVDGYFDSLLQFLDQAAQQKFVKKVHRDMLMVSECPDSLIGLMVKQAESQS